MNLREAAAKIFADHDAMGCCDPKTTEHIWQSLEPLLLSEPAVDGETLLATLTDRFHEARAGTPEWRDGVRLGLQIAMNEVSYAAVPGFSAALPQPGEPTP